MVAPTVFNRLTCGTLFVLSVLSTFLVPCLPSDNISYLNIGLGTISERADFEKLCKELPKAQRSCYSEYSSYNKRVEEEIQSLEEKNQRLMDENQLLGEQVKELITERDKLLKDLEAKDHLLNMVWAMYAGMIRDFTCRVITLVRIITGLKKPMKKEKAQSGFYPLGEIYEVGDDKRRYVLQYVVHTIRKPVVHKILVLQSNIHHPVLCDFLDQKKGKGASTEPVQIWYEAIEGISLAQYLIYHPFSAHEVVWISMNILSVLCYLSKFGYVHNGLDSEQVVLVDRKSIWPNSVLIKVLPSDRMRREDSDDNVKELNKDRYTSPECFHGCQIDSRDDIWAFGVLLYELITGSKGGIISPEEMGGKSVDDIVAQVQKRLDPSQSRYTSNLEEEQLCKLRGILASIFVPKTVRPSAPEIYVKFIESFQCIFGPVLESGNCLAVLIHQPCSMPNFESTFKKLRTPEERGKGSGWFDGIFNNI